MVLSRRARELAPRAVRVLDLGAGNGWLCYRVRQLGHWAIALDFRTDAVDGLGAAPGVRARLMPLFPRVAATFEAIPLAGRSVDIAVFNASLHYALDLRATLAEAARVVVRAGRVVILDSPFYRRAADGEAMVAEKRRTAPAQFGDLASDLMALPFVEYLTAERLAQASLGLGLTWRRHRVLYPVWYELRPLAAFFRRRRPPSRFDLWEAAVR
jgi:SAM-dependent methyltransferase